MLKTLITFIVLSLFSGNAIITQDQGETIVTSSPKKCIRELCDETVTFFLSNPNLAEKLASKDAFSQTGNLSVQEQQILQFAEDMHIKDMIIHMHKIKNQQNRECITQPTKMSESELSQIKMTFY